MVDSRRNRAIETLYNLQGRLTQIVDRDPEQEVQGIALPALDGALADARQFVDPGDPVIQQLTEVISPESVDAGEPIRCVDALMVVDVLLGRLGDREVEIGSMGLDYDPY